MILSRYPDDNILFSPFGMEDMLMVAFAKTEGKTQSRIAQVSKIKTQISPLVFYNLVFMSGYYSVMMKARNDELFHESTSWGLFTWPKQDDQANMTKIGEHDRKIDNDEH